MRGHILILSPFLDFPLCIPHSIPTFLFRIFFFFESSKSKILLLSSNHCHLQLTGRVLPNYLSPKWGQHFGYHAGDAVGGELGQDPGWEAGQGKAGLYLRRKDHKEARCAGSSGAQVKHHRSHTLKAESRLPFHTNGEGIVMAKEYANILMLDCW